MPAAELRLGIDVGATHTDAVVLDERDRLLAKAKVPSSPDVHAGVAAAIDRLPAAGVVASGTVASVMLSTTAMTAAVEQRSGLGRVAALRIGSPVGDAIPPLTNWPADLRRVVGGARATVRGGAEFDGRAIAPLDEDAVCRFLDEVAGATHSVAITSVFSPVAPEQELAAAGLVAAELGPAVHVSMSHQTDGIGLLARENATILNAALYQVIGGVRDGLQATLADRGLDVATYFAQNDGTLMAIDYAAGYPVLTIGSGPANSIRGAAFLSGLTDAIVADVGGTSTDFGVLSAGFPRESAAGVEIGGVRTNFRMPDILALALGGGTVIGPDGAVGPRSVGYRITEEAFTFGGSTPTLTDAGVLAGRAALNGGPVPDRLHDTLAGAMETADRMLADAVDRMTLGKTDRTLIVVGGGAFLVPDRLPGVAEVIRPDHGDVANAVGAAIALASGTIETIIPAGDGRREAIDDASENARRRAVQAGADPAEVEVVEITEVPMSYLPEPALRLRVKAAGPLGSL